MAGEEAMPDPRQVRSMFARIAPNYDFLNRVLSAGIDRRWRRALVARAGDVRGRVVLDLCCGTGDVALAFARQGARVLAFDFTHEMLRRAWDKDDAKSDGSARIVFADADALHVPARDRSIDVCSVAFGMRNVAEPARALSEIQRVLRPGGMALVLEFSMPEGAVLSRAYRAYFTRCLPVLGALVSRDKDAYRYLPRTVLAWPKPDEFQHGMERAGFGDCGYAPLSRGIAHLHWGRAREDAHA
jgi:demethylmenaquinone methyltransferase/2-methoxy-6-polyprenyl-1,4-benzoquinol methylase